MNCRDARCSRCTQRGSLGLVVLGLLATVFGCESKSPLVPVHGIVMLDGTPLESGVVQFHPTAGQVASGEISAGGEFVLSTHSAGDGVLPGTYRVTIVPAAPANENSAEENPLPLRYSRAGASGLQVTIFPNSAAPVKLELVSGDLAIDTDARSADQSHDAQDPTTIEGATEVPPGDANREQLVSP